jgi:hypothetical protein
MTIEEIEQMYRELEERYVAVENVLDQLVELFDDFGYKLHLTTSFGWDFYIRDMKEHQRMAYVVANRHLQFGVGTYSTIMDLEQAEQFHADLEESIGLIQRAELIIKGV